MVKMKANNAGTVLVALVFFQVCVAALLAPAAVNGQQLVEGVVAVVGKELILRSELEEQVMMFCVQQGIEPTDSTAIKEVMQDILDSMIDAKVIVNEARSRNMGVSKQELESAVDDAVMEVKTRIGSEERFQEELAREGLTEEKLRERYRKDLEAQLLARKLVDKEVTSKVTVTDKEVEQFYQNRKGELPKKPPEVSLAQIVILSEVDSLVDAAAKKRAQEVLDAVKSGQSFERLASQFSDDPSAQNGGDVGFFRKGDFEEGFEKVAFALEPGQVSGLVRSRFGYHIIKMVEKEDDMAHVKHILIKTVPTEKAEQEARTRATEVRKLIESGQSFEDVARKHSEDPETAPKGGLVGSYIVEGLSPVIKNAIKGLPVGGVTEVIPMDVGYHIFKIVGKAPEGEYTYEEVKDRLRQLVIQEKSQNVYETWLDGIKKKTFIDVRGL